MTLRHGTRNDTRMFQSQSLQLMFDLAIFVQAVPFVISSREWLSFNVTETIANFFLFACKHSDSLYYHWSSFMVLIIEQNEKTVCPWHFKTKSRHTLHGKLLGSKLWQLEKGDDCFNRVIAYSGSTVVLFH